MPAPLPVGTSQAEIDAIYASIQADSYNRARVFAASIAPRYLNRHISIALGLAPGPMPSALPTGVDQQEYNDILADITAKGDAHCLKLINEQWPNFLLPNLADELAASPPTTIVGTQYSFMTAGTLPTGATLTRASTGWYFNSSKALTSAASNAARWNYDYLSGALQGLLNEPTATSGSRNSNGDGAVVGSPGTHPSGWSTSLSGAVTTSIVASTVINGIKFLDVRYQGTTNNLGGYGELFDAGYTVTATPGSPVTEAVWLALVGGSFANITSVSVLLTYNSTGSLQSPSLINQITSTPQRFSVSGVVPAGNTGMLPRIGLNWLNGAPVDLTLRFGMPTAELNAAASSPVISTSPPTTVVTRAADVLTITAPQKTYSTVLVNRLGNQTMANNVTVGAGGYVVPTDPSPLQSVQFIP